MSRGYCNFEGFRGLLALVLTSLKGDTMMNISRSRGILALLLAVLVGFTFSVAGPANADAGDVHSLSSGVSPQIATFATWSGVERWSGSDRYDTTVQASERAFPGGVDTVVIATGENWPDALCAAPLCGVESASLLLVRLDSIPTVVLDEIERLGATSAIILGGTGAVSANVQTDLSGLLDSVRRIEGVNRYETAAKIAAEVMAAEAWDGSAFYVTGANFPDALGASAIAAFKKWPILLSASTYLPLETQAVDGDVDAGFIVGGTGAIDSSVESGLQSRMTVVRLSGSNRYETTKVVMDYAVANWGTSVARVGVASGANFPDALAAGVAMGVANQGQLLTSPTYLSSPTSIFLNGKRGQTEEVVVFGGTGAVAESVVDEIEALMWSAEFSGTGDTASSAFTLDAGLAVFDMTHIGSSNFIVHLLDMDGHVVEYLANEIGDYDGSAAVGIDTQGSYYLDIDADGPWSISITQPRPSLSSLLYTNSFSGTGPTATSLFRMSGGARTFTLTHSGSSNFIVHLLDMDGHVVEYLANEIGDYSGSTISGVDSGGYLLSIDADGPWSITID